MADFEITQIDSTIHLTASHGDSHIRYQFRGRDREPQPLRLESSGNGLASLLETGPGRDPYAIPEGFVPGRQMPEPSSLELQLEYRKDCSIELAHRQPVRKGATWSYNIVPDLWVDGAPLGPEVSRENIAVHLPSPTARLLASNLSPSRVSTTPEGTIVEFERSHAHPGPISIHWTERSEEARVEKQVQRIGERIVGVTIRVHNPTGHGIERLLVEDVYSNAVAQVVPDKGLVLDTTHPRNIRVVFRSEIDLPAGHTETLRYQVEATTVRLPIPTTNAILDGEIIGCSARMEALELGKPFKSRPAALAVPIGWSLDFTHGDHHLSDHSIACRSQRFYEDRRTLTWTVHSTYRDWNSDDDYRWSVHHRLLHLDPGTVIHGETQTVRVETGGEDVRELETQHDDLVGCADALVLLRGWDVGYLDREDHHINVVGLAIEQTNFDPSTGTITWKLRVQYGDKNFDDGFEHRVFYSLVGFGGRHVRVPTRSGSAPSGGSAADEGSMVDPRLKGYKSATVLLVGWKFDFHQAGPGSDHHIDEQTLSIQNVDYDPTTGTVAWLTSLSFQDKNHDDDYTWEYQVVIVVSNEVEAGYYFSGPYSSEGHGEDQHTQKVDLPDIMTPVTWTNQIRDGDETGVDCGGSSPAVHVPCLLREVAPGDGSSSALFSLHDPTQSAVVRQHAMAALREYASSRRQKAEDLFPYCVGDSNDPLVCPEEPDRCVEAVAEYVDHYMAWVLDENSPAEGTRNGAQSAYITLTATGHRSALPFAGDCEDYAILRAALLRVLGFNPRCIFCAEHHSDVDQGQADECSGKEQPGGGHAFNIVVYQGKYRIMDYGPMQPLFWSGRAASVMHVTDNIWNDHTGKYLTGNSVTPFGDVPLVNYPGNPSSPGPTWNWRTYFNDVTR